MALAVRDLRFTFLFMENCQHYLTLTFSQSTITYINLWRAEESLNIKSNIMFLVNLNIHCVEKNSMNIILNPVFAFNKKIGLMQHEDVFHL